MEHGSPPDSGRVVDLGIDGYEQAVEVGRGGFSVVYRARQPAFQRYVAIKILSVVLDDARIDRFRRECEAIGSLSGHPNIVTVYDSGRLANGRPYLVMELLPSSLGERLGQGRLGWVEVVEIGIKLAGALESAHRVGVLHRDVKPENVLVSRYGDYKLGDFGLASIEGRTQSQPGVVAATWVHAPPEVLGGKRRTARSDVYSLASTLFTLVAGSPAHARPSDDDLMAVLARIASDPVPDLRPGVPDRLACAVEQGMAKDPSQRQGTADELGRQLQAVQRAAGQPVTALPLERDRPRGQPTVDKVVAENAPALAPPTRRNRRTGALVGAALVVVLAVLLLALRWGGDGEDLASQTTVSVASTTMVSKGATGTGASVTATTSAPTGPSTTALRGVRLGPDLTALATEPCRVPSTASGAAWQLGPVQLGGRGHEVAYFCNLLAGANGSIDFTLGATYRSMRMSFGFADDSGSTAHTIRIEVIGDGRDYLTNPRTLRFGEQPVQDLDVDVTGVTRLKVRVTELSPAGGSEGTSKPVLAMTLARP